jgi:hypothetical protein
VSQARIATDSRRDVERSRQSYEPSQPVNNDVVARRVSPDRVSPISRPRALNLSALRQQEQLVEAPDDGVPSPIEDDDGDIPEGDISILLQPETRPITHEQLVNEVKGIYAGLVMVEKKCVEITQQQAKSTSKLTNDQWQALTALHFKKTGHQVRHACSNVATWDTFLPRATAPTTAGFFRAYACFRLHRLCDDGTAHGVGSQLP